MANIVRHQLEGKMNIEPLTKETKEGFIETLEKKYNVLNPWFDEVRDNVIVINTHYSIIPKKGIKELVDLVKIQDGKINVFIEDDVSDIFRKYSFL